MNQIIRDLFNFILRKCKVVSAAVKRLFMPEYVLGKVRMALKKAFEKVFHIKPRHSGDYYHMGRYLVSRRLVSMIIFVTGIAGLYYLLIINPPAFLSRGLTGVKTYRYNSIPLRYVSDVVKIRAKSGYTAYYGEVEKGKANGTGILYTKTGEIRYDGAFENSEYQGTGSLYEDGCLRYQGEFAHNVYQGEGRLYRTNGSMEYEGNFKEGEKSGEGKLYDSSNNLIYTGSFQTDELMYEELLGKTTGEVTERYTGTRTIYYDDENFVVDMEEIGAVYAGSTGENYLDDSILVQRVFVKSTDCILAGKSLDTIAQIKEIAGESSFEGNSVLLMEEAVAMEETLQTEHVFEDVLEVKEYPQDKEIYLYMFEYNGIQYTFYSYDRDGGFVMYSIEKQ